MNFSEELDGRVKTAEEVLKRYLPEPEGIQKTVVEAMRYSALAGGKRLRPILMLETYRLFGGKSGIVEPFMAAVEMIHTYSLVHDDLPAMDNDDYRRGRKTAHIVYGEAVGILAGDGLLNLAFETAAKAFDMFPEESLRAGKAISLLAGKAGVCGMIGGQVADIESSGKKISGEKLRLIYGMKTSALIEGAMMTGAILAGADEEETRDIGEIAGKAGLAFQIRDDILDVMGAEKKLGKPVLSDEKNKKTTYVTVVGLRAASEEVERLSAEAAELLRRFGSESEFLANLLISLIRRER